MVGALIQVLLAIVIVIVLFAFAFFTYNRELLKAIQNASRKAQEVPIFTGIVDLADVKNREFNTRESTHPSYRNINPSYNQLAGAEFTYNFWMFMDPAAIPLHVAGEVQRTDAGISANDLVLFLKGNKTTYTYKNVCNVNKTDVLVKCPLVKLQRGGDVLSVEFNTLSSPEGVREQSRNTCKEASADWAYMNAHKLAISGLRTGPNATNYIGKWFMVTVIIQDTNPSDPLPMRNKCRCRIFVNGTLELDRYVDGKIGSFSRDASVLRQNQGNMHLAPVIEFSNNMRTMEISSTTNSRKMMMADMTYYNYALEPATISSMFKNGFNKSFAVLADTSTYDPLNGAKVDSLSYGSDKKQLNGF